MPSTLKYKITYPSGSQAPNVPIVMQTQSESVETALKSIEPGAWTAITLTSPWVPYGSAGNGYYNGLRARKLPGGIQFQGMVKGGTTSTKIATIPAEFLPEFSSIHYTYTGSASGNIWVDTAAASLTYLSGAASPTYVNISIFVPTA